MFEPAPVAQYGKCGLRDPRPVSPPQFGMRPKEFPQKHIRWPNAGQQPANCIFKQPKSNATGHTCAFDSAADHTAGRASTPRTKPRTNPLARRESPLRGRSLGQSISPRPDRFSGTPRLIRCHSVRAFQ